MHALAAEFEDKVVRYDIYALFDGFLCRLERLMLHQLQTSRVINERISCNTRLGLVCLGETAVDNQQLTAGLDGLFALGYLDGNMTVDNVCMRPVDAELAQDAVAHSLFVAQRILPLWPPPCRQ